MSQPAPSDPGPVTREERIALAMQMIDLGFALFSLKPKSKEPWTANGFKDATRDKDKVRAFLSNPGATSYGMVWPEDAPGDPVLEWDVDGADWRPKFKAMVALYGKLPTSLRTKTPHGYHLFFRVRPEVAAIDAKSVKNKMLGFVVRKPWKGYVVGPGSVIDDPEKGETDLVYTSDNGFIIDYLPEAWQRAALAEAGQHLRTVAPLIVVDEGYVLPTTIEPGGRYNAIVEYTAHRYNRGDTEKQMWALVQHELAPLFTEPYPEGGLRERFERAIRGMSDRLGPPATVARGKQRLTVEERQQQALSKGAYQANPFTQYAHREMEWLWGDWLGRKTVTILDGNPGMGKSNIVMDLIARLSTGDNWPDGAKGWGKPLRTLYITTEDAPDTTLGPRLLAAGGDPAFVYFLEEEFTLPDDEPRLAALIAELEPALVVIDPVSSHIGADVKQISDNDVRVNVMNPLQRLAEGGNCAVLPLRHFSKNVMASALNRGAGSLGGFAGKAREVWSVTADPDDEEGKRRIFGITKNNYGPDHLALKYHIEGVLLPGWKRTVSHVVWDGRSHVSVAEVMDDQTPERTEGAIAKLRGILAAGPMKPSDVVTAMAQGNPKVSRSGTYRAARRMGVIMERTGFQGGSIWRSGEVTLNVPFQSSRARVETETNGTNGTNDESVSARMAAIFSSEEPHSSHSSHSSHSYSDDVIPVESETNEVYDMMSLPGPDWDDDEDGGMNGA